MRSHTEKELTQGHARDLNVVLSLHIQDTLIQPHGFCFLDLIQHTRCNHVDVKHVEGVRLELAFRGEPTAR